MCCHKRLLLDTMVFNHLRDGKVDVSLFDGWTLCATHVQKEEIRETQNTLRRDELLKCFHDINPEVLRAETFAWGITGAGWDQASWSKPDGLFDEIKSAMEDEDRKDKRKRKRLLDKPENCFHDALTAEVAIRNNLTLITNDPSLRAIVPIFGGKVISLADLSEASGSFP